MLVELSVMEQRYQAVLAVEQDGWNACTSTSGSGAPLVTMSLRPDTGSWRMSLEGILPSVCMSCLAESGPYVIAAAAFIRAYGIRLTGEHSSEPQETVVADPPLKKTDFRREIRRLGLKPAPRARHAVPARAARSGGSAR